MSSSEKECPCECCEQDRNYEGSNRETIIDDVEQCKSCGTFVHSDGRMLDEKEAAEFFTKLSNDYKNRYHMPMHISRMIYVTHIASLEAMKYKDEFQEKYGDEWYEHLVDKTEEIKEELLDLLKKAEASPNVDVYSLPVYDPRNLRQSKGPDQSNSPKK